MTETHEPQMPLANYPYSHVKVNDVFMDDCDECVCIMIHGQKHYLHRTTAYSLYEQLQEYFKNLSNMEKDLLIQFGTNLGNEILN